MRRTGRKKSKKVFSVEVKAPFFSVVLPLHPHRPYFHQSLLSILSQNFKDFEVLAVGSDVLAKGTVKAKFMRDRRIRMIPARESDLSVARNSGINASRGAYVAFLDPGDEWAPDFLAQIKKLIGDFPEAGLYGTNYWIDDGVEKKGNPLRLPPGWRGRRRNFYDLMYYGRPPFCASSVALPTDLARQNHFPEGILAGEDLLVWFKISLKWDMAYFNKHCSTYRIKAFENKQGRYFGPLKHLDWLALGTRLKREGLLPWTAENFVVWAALLQVRKMIANGRREQAMVLWARCPKIRLPLYQAYLACQTFLPPLVWKILEPGVKISRYLLTGGFFTPRKS